MPPPRSSRRKCRPARQSQTACSGKVERSRIPVDWELRRGARASLPSLSFDFHYRGAPGMNPRFPGFPPEGIAFLRNLKKHNEREWFQPRKEIYDRSVKAPMLELVTAVMQALADFSPQFV